MPLTIIDIIILIIIMNFFISNFQPASLTVALNNSLLTHQQQQTIKLSTAAAGVNNPAAARNPSGLGVAAVKSEPTVQVLNTRFCSSPNKVKFRVYPFV